MNGINFVNKVLVLILLYFFSVIYHCRLVSIDQKSCSSSSSSSYKVDNDESKAENNDCIKIYEHNVFIACNRIFWSKQKEMFLFGHEKEEEEDEKKRNKNS